MIAHRVALEAAEDIGISWRCPSQFEFTSRPDLSISGTVQSVPIRLPAHTGVPVRCAAALLNDKNGGREDACQYCRLREVQYFFRKDQARVSRSAAERFILNTLLARINDRSKTAASPT